MRQTNTTKPIAINIAGKMVPLCRYLLELPDRPVPKAPTHYVMVDILNKDLSIKRITIYFNPTDTWENPEQQWESDKPRWIGNLIGDHLGFLGPDPNTLAYTYWVIEIAANSIVYKGNMYDFCNYDAY